MVCLCGIILPQITRLGDRIGKLSPMQRKLGIRRILGAVSEAYGRMMLYEGLFQADGHPGNILVMRGGRRRRCACPTTCGIQDLQLCDIPEPCSECFLIFRRNRGNVELL